jgi:hypothetical protein
MLAAVIAAAAFSACSGNDDCCADLESYLRRVDQIDNKLSADIDEMNRDLDNSIAGSSSLTEDTRDEIAEAYGRGEEIVAGVVDDLQEIEPPPEAADEHAEAIAGFDEFRGAFATLRLRVPQIETTADLIAAITGQADAGERANAACDALQQLATANNIDVTLECGIENP